jgi:hypothetical protein
MAGERKKGVEAEREPNFLLARLERRFLPWAAGKLPPRTSQSGTGWW